MNQFSFVFSLLLMLCIGFVGGIVLAPVMAQQGTLLVRAMGYPSDQFVKILWHHRILAQIISFDLPRHSSR